MEVLDKSKQGNSKLYSDTEVLFLDYRKCDVIVMHDVRMIGNYLKSLESMGANIRWPYNGNGEDKIYGLDRILAEKDEGIGIILLSSEDRNTIKRAIDIKNKYAGRLIIRVFIVSDSVRERFGYRKEFGREVICCTANGFPYAHEQIFEDN